MQWVRSARVAHVVLPGDVDDVDSPSGGNHYDRRLCQGLAASGWSVHEIALRGTWPDPDASVRTQLGCSLAELPDGALVVLDGLVACGVPDVVVPAANRLRLAVLVHLPLGCEVGRSPDVAAALDAREREVLSAATLVVATSPWTARHLVSHHGTAADRIRVITPGIDAAPLAPGSDGRSQLLCVGAVTPTKGQDLLVEALATMVEVPWTCVCVGPLHRDPAGTEQIRQAIAAYGLSERIQLAGPQPPAQLAMTYAAADLVVLPSRVETYGMVLTEALARGIPVVATAVGGVPETLGQAADGELPGILVTPDDPAVLAAALRRWLGEPELRLRLRSSARRSRGILSPWEATVEQMAGVLERLAGVPG